MQSAISSMLSQAELGELFEYHDGELYPTVKCNGIKGRPAGHKNGRYRAVLINYKRYASHRLVWVWHNGDIPPKMQIDHIDHNPYNNRIENLRMVDNTNNGRNRFFKCKTQTGANGIRRTKNGRFSAVITLGTFDTVEEAVAFRKRHERLLGFHPNHGRVVQ